MLARSIAETILTGFNKHFRIFQEITRQAREYFIAAHWEAARAAVRDRIMLYDLRIHDAFEELESRFQVSGLDHALWQEVKLQYMGLLYEHRQPELAESFYNSLFCRMYDRRYYNNDNIFVRPALSTDYLEGERPAYRSHYPTRDGWPNVLTEILNHADLGVPFEDQDRDIRNIVQALRAQQGGPLGQSSRYLQLQVLTPIFYRNKGAYIVGRAFNDFERCPFILPLLQNGRGRVFVDALVTDADDVDNLFSFARAYFLVDCEVPSALVRFLLSISPTKKAADLYTAIGFQKQGKAEFYRDFLHHLSHSDEKLVFAPGTKGMVMSVFTLPSYPYVFKVIKDRFRLPKETTREEVRAKYQLVKRHDRVGRMADTWEFSYAAFPLERFTEALLAELRSEASSMLAVEDDQVIIRHLYIERRVVPLNLYLVDAAPADIDHAIQDYGDAIKQIAAVGIFPGDLLFQNFGLTRHKRVIFYDYDEIVPIQDCRFLPSSPSLHSPEESDVGPNDVFPEELRNFLFSSAALAERFEAHHPELLTPEAWCALQQSAYEGAFPDVFPYPEERRFLPTVSPSG